MRVACDVEWVVFVSGGGVQARRSRAGAAQQGRRGCHNMYGAVHHGAQRFLIFWLIRFYSCTDADP
jgi:hypothetical protein